MKGGSWHVSRACAGKEGTQLRNFLHLICKERITSHNTMSEVYPVLFSA